MLSVPSQRLADQLCPEGSPGTAQPTVDRSRTVLFPSDGGSCCCSLFPPGEMEQGFPIPMCLLALCCLLVQAPGTGHVKNQQKGGI